ncbi:hypothetical protein PENTCL1PPCAC_14312, partial [Pristionchus entomophagus]
SSRSVPSLRSGSSDRLATVHALLSGLTDGSLVTQCSRTSDWSRHAWATIATVRSLRSIGSGHSSESGVSVRATRAMTTSRAVEASVHGHVVHC